MQEATLSLVGNATVLGLWLLGCLLGNAEHMLYALMHPHTSALGQRAAPINVPCYVGRELHLALLGL